MISDETLLWGTKAYPVDSFSDLVSMFYPSFLGQSYEKVLMDNGMDFYYFNTKNENLDGLFIEFCDGEVIKVENYENGNRSGVALYKMYQKDKNGTIRTIIVEAEFDGESDKKKGYYREFVLNGNRLKDEHFLMDVKDGWNRWYYDSGENNIWIEGNYVDDKREGVSKEYYENGILKVEGIYKNDVLVEVVKHNQEDESASEMECTACGGHYTHDVNMIVMKKASVSGPLYGVIENEKGEYLQVYSPEQEKKGLYGLIVDQQDRNRRNNQLFREYEEVSTVKIVEGKRHWISPIGEVLMKEVKDKEIEGYYLGKKRFLVHLDDAKNLHGYYCEYFDNGNKRYEGLFVHGKREGHHYQYYGSGAVHIIATYHRDRLTRESEIYSEKGYRLYFISYIDDILEFKWVHYSDLIEDQPIEEIRFLHGKKVGLHLLYDSQGNQHLAEVLNELN